MADWRKIRASQNRPWMRFLPEEVYDTSDSSHMVRVMDAMCGEAGVGRARKEGMLKRMQTSMSETRMYDLDRLYSRVFDMPRLRSESYETQPDALLTWDEHEEVMRKDAHYRRRLWAYMQAFMYGGTRRGIELAVEAATATPTQVIDADEYARAAKLGEKTGQKAKPAIGVSTDERANTVDDSTPQFGIKDPSPYGPVDYGECVACVMRDEPLTEEERFVAYHALARIAPSDVRVTILTRREMAERFVLPTANDVYVPINKAQASSSWWNVTRFVTGRPDWEYKKYPHLWIVPNREREAPRLALNFCQEDSVDLTYMIDDVASSSAHAGSYGRYAQSFFPGISKDGDEEESSAWGAVSRAVSRIYTASSYGAEPVIDWSYPVEYIPALDEKMREASRWQRWWSSVERPGDEWVELSFKRSVPIDHMEFNVSRKPVNVVPFYGTTRDESGRAGGWVQMTSKDGFPLNCRIEGWSASASASEFMTMVFDFTPVQATGIRIEVRREPKPYMLRRRDGTYDQLTFDYSVELADLSVRYDVLRRADYMDFTYEDPFGNRVRTEIRELLPDRLIDGDDSTYWVSQADIGEDAVEWLVLDVRTDGNPSRVNFIDIDAVYDGCQMNVYSSDDAKTWSPYPQSFTLRSGRFELPTRQASWLKLEFTRLCAIPYQVIRPEIMVDTLRFPSDERMYARDAESNTYQMDYSQRLLTDASSMDANNATVYDEIGAKDIYEGLERSAEVPSGLDSTRYWGGLFTKAQWRNYNQSSISSALGDSMAVESPILSPMVVRPVEQTIAPVKFRRRGEHEYDARKYERTTNLAYVVGIKSVRCGFQSDSMTVRPGQTWYVDMGDARKLDTVVGWKTVSDERLQVADESMLCTIETTDVGCVAPFRSFDFAVNQREPDEAFLYPSDMANEWSGINADVSRADFGVSGKTLRAELAPSGVTGVTSEPKLVRMMGVAKASVDVFPLIDGTWTLECTDVFGESVFSMSYECEGGRWNTLGCVFNPMPGGGWWDTSYDCRIRIPITGPMRKGACVFVPWLDEDALKAAGISTDALLDIRLIHFNGVSNEVLPMDRTGNMERWFKVQEDIPSGIEADGRWHDEAGGFVGAYYLYFGSKTETEGEVIDYRRVFDAGDLIQSGGTQGDRGRSFTSSNDFSEVADSANLTLSQTDGFISLEYEPESEPDRVPDGTTGIAKSRFLVDYADDSGFKVQAYLYERQLTFVVVDPDGYESAFVSSERDAMAALTPGKRHLMLFQWWERGTAEVTKATSDTESAVDPSIALRRKVEVRVDGTTPMRCIDNVYDERHYNDGTY